MFGAKKVENQDIENWARKAFKYLKDNPEESFYYTCTGDSICIGLQFRDEITIIVARDYYSYEYDKDQKESGDIDD